MREEDNEAQFLDRLLGFAATISTCFCLVGLMAALFSALKEQYISSVLYLVASSFLLTATLTLRLKRKKLQKAQSELPSDSA